MISPRKNEIDAALAVLESDDFDDARAMAKALVAAVGDQLAQREAYLIIAPDGALCWGPYYTEGQVRKAWEKEIGPATGGAARFVRSFPWAAEAAREQAGACECGHQPEQHVVRNLRGGKVSAPGACGVCAHTVRKGAPNGCANYTRRAS